MMVIGRGYGRERIGWLTIKISLFKVNIRYKVRSGLSGVLEMAQDSSRNTATLINFCIV